MTGLEWGCASRGEVLQKPLGDTLCEVLCVVDPVECEAMKIAQHK